MGSSGSPAKPTIVEEFYTYDRASNRTGRYDERPGAVTANSDSRFVYDGLHRLRTEERGRAAGGYGGGWTFAPLSRQWDLDLLGNWRELRYDVSNGSSGPPNGVFGDGDDAEEVRDHNMANEIVERTPSGVGALGFAHDHAGNTRTVLDPSEDGTRYTHDAWNRLVRVETVEGGSAFATVAAYQYNGLHWRTLRDNFVDERDLFYYSSDWQLIEEHRIAHEGNPAEGDLVRVAQQFWGLRYIDDAIARRIDGNADGDYDDTESAQDPDGTWFYLTDVQFSVVALLTDTAELVERVQYDAYGRARHRWFTDLDGDGDADNNDFFAQLAAQATSIHADANYRPDADHDRNGVINNDDFFAFLAGAGQAALPYGLISDPLGPDNPVGHNSCIFAPEAGLNVPTGSPQPQAVGAYIVRFRWYLPETGRWSQKDPVGYVDGMNLLAAFHSAPLNWVDPVGLLCNPPRGVRGGRPYQDYDDLDAILEFRGRFPGDTSKFRGVDALTLNENSLLRDILNIWQLGECIAEDPTQIVSIVSQAGWELAKEDLVALGKLSNLLLWINFTPDGVEFDESRLWSKDFIDALNGADARISVGRLDANCRAQRSVVDAIDLWLKNGARTGEDYSRLAERLVTLERQAGSLARHRIYRHYLATFLGRAANVAGPIGTAITAADFAEKIWDQVREQCGQCSGCEGEK